MLQYCNRYTIAKTTGLQNAIVVMRFVASRQTGRLLMMQITDFVHPF